MAWMAAVGAAFILDRNFRRAGIPVDAVSIVAIGVVSGMIGAKLLAVIETPIDIHEMNWRVLWSGTGFSWYGGVLFGIPTAILLGLRAKIGGLRMLDLTAPSMAIGNGIGRIGCFLSGDGCYGIDIKPVHFLFFTFRPWGMSFPKGLEPVFVPVYPTPLYEMAAAFLICGWLWWRGGKPRGTGDLAGEYLVLAGIARFLVEFIRRNPKVLWGLTDAQLASAVAVVAGIVLIWRAATHPVKKPEEAAAVVAENAA
jgi:phosphatidylglycerol:prolipoprotein diacylglycerol transferase